MCKQGVAKQCGWTNATDATLLWMDASVFRSWAELLWKIQPVSVGARESELNFCLVLHLPGLLSLKTQGAEEVVIMGGGMDGWMDVMLHGLVSRISLTLYCKPHLIQGWTASSLLFFGHFLFVSSPEELLCKTQPYMWFPAVRFPPIHPSRTYSLTLSIYVTLLSGSYPKLTSCCPAPQPRD